MGSRVNQFVGVWQKLSIKLAAIGTAVVVATASLAGGWAHAASQAVYSTYFGGSANEMGLGSYADSQGNYYTTGSTASSDYPVTANAAQPTYGGGDTDTFVAKFNSSGSLVYSTYLGGSGHDEGRGIASDSVGNIYVSGYTESSNFPNQNGSDPTLGGSRDAFLTKISPTGSILFSTYFGGSATDSAMAMSIDSSGSVYLTGETNSADFPTTTGAFSRTESGDVDTYVSKISSSGSLVYSTFLGSPGFDDGLAMTVDGSGNAFVTGKASPGFPITAGAYDSTQNGGYDMFVTKLNSTGSALVFSTYLGGDNWDEGLGIGVDAAGNSYVTGNVQSSNYPTTAGAYQRTFTGFVDASITKLNPTGTALVYSTLIGGNQWVEGDGLALDANGNAYIAGHEGSSDYPVTANAFQSTYGGNVDGFLAEINTTGSGLLYSTYLGGSDWDGAMTFTLGSNGVAYLGGGTSSTNYPVTAGAYQSTLKGADDGIATAISVPVALAPTNTTAPVVTGNPVVGSTLTTSTGVWANNPTSYTYQWRSATSSTGPWTNISGATSSTYLVASGDVGKYLSAQVTASNAAGSNSAASNAVGPVTTAPGQMTFNIATGADDGDVSTNNMGGSGTYPPQTTPVPWSTGTNFGARRAGPIFGGYEVRTGLVRFNTSSLPAGATITSASLRLYVLNASSVNNRSLVAEWYNNAVWPLTASDYTVTASSTASTGLSISSLRANAYNTLSLQNLSSISRAAYTTIRLHVSGVQPTGENLTSFASLENGSGTVPQLVINYTP